MARATQLTPDALTFLNRTRALPAVAVVAVKFAVAVTGWTTLRRTRKALRQLEPWQLADVGLTPAQARTEAARVFWKA